MSRQITFSDWKKKLRDEIWPSGYPENLLNVINSFFIAGCMDMQRAIECLQENNASIFPACATWWGAGMTFVNAPAQRCFIKRVWTIANDGWENKVFYHQREYADLAQWSLKLNRYTVPTAATPLPMGDRVFSNATDSTLGRSRRGIWALWRKRVYLAPWIQSNETIVIEWDGVRTDWKDTDLIDLDVWDPLFEEALKLYVKWCYERDYGTEITVSRECRSNYDNAIALLISDCIQATRVRKEEGTAINFAPNSTTITAEKVPADSTVAPAFAIIGGYGTGDDNEIALADTVKDWSPTAIITTGGNNGGDITDFNEWDRRVGSLFEEYIFPYSGIYGSGDEDTNRFWPTLDLAELTSADVFAEYFPSVGNVPYYTAFVGNVQFFIVNAANDYTSQMQWLQGALALSVSRWKVVVINSATDLDQQFSSWGANLVIYGRSQTYERTPTRIAFGSLSAPAALKVSSSCSQLQIVAYNKDGGQIDAVTLM